MHRRMAARSGGDHRQRPPPLTFPPSFPHSTPFPHWISQNEIIKWMRVKFYESAVSENALAKLGRREFRWEMAFCGKLGGLLRQSVSRSNISHGSAPVMHLLNSARYMSSSKLFVGARVITDRDTGRSRGFGFVNFDSNESASSALSSMDGQELQGSNIRVSYANDRPSGPSGGYRGGFGSGSGGVNGNSTRWNVELFMLVMLEVLCIHWKDGATIRSVRLKLTE